MQIARKESSSVRLPVRCGCVVGLGVGASQDVLVEALVSFRRFGAVVRTDAELEVALVIGGQLDADLDGRALLVRAHDHPLAVATAVLVSARLSTAPNNNSVKTDG